MSAEKAGPIEAPAKPKEEKKVEEKPPAKVNTNPFGKKEEPAKAAPTR